MNKDDFIDKFFDRNSIRKCVYCGVHESKLGLMETVRSGRGERLEYDRLISRDKDGNKLDYNLCNVELACYWCNNAKTDTFSPKEFKGIARAINILWNDKLKASGDKSTIFFDENAVIWECDN